MMEDISIDFRCFICNLSDIPVTEGISVFDENAVLESGLKLSEAVSQILGREIDPLVSHSSVVCKKCYKSCEEYDEINKRLSSLKSKMANQFRKTMPASNVSQDRDSSSDLPDALVKIEFDDNAQIQQTNKQMKKIYVSKSKMIPLPANYNQKYLFLNSNKTVHSNKSKPVAVFVSPTESSATPSTALVKQKPALIMTKSIKTKANTSPSHLLMLNRPKKTPIATLNETGNKTIFDGSKKIQNTLNKIPQQNSTLNIVKSPKGKSLQLSTKANNSLKAASCRQGVRPQESEKKYVISEVDMLNDHDDDDGETDTILMDEDGSILQVLRGDQRKLLSQVNQISLVLTQEGEESESRNTKIELQMVDEKDTTATVNAFKEQNATYIQMGDSGDVYEVDSVPIAEADKKTMDCETRAVVEQIGTAYRCLVCKAKVGESSHADGTSDETEKQITLYSKPSDIITHMKKAHDLRLHVCCLCGDSFLKRSDYEVHLVEHNSRPVSTEIEKKQTDEKLRQKSYPCKICMKKYVSKNLLEEHMNVHSGSRPYCCSVCQKNFANKYSFHTHLKTHSERPRPYTCDKCDKTFLSLQHTLQHEKIHSGIKEFICNICKKSFRTQHNLDIHSVVHSDSKPYVCGVCEKGFARKAEIRDHLRTHTGERPYACDICGQRFAQSSNMVSHRRTTHFDDRRYPCTQCDKRFKRRRLLEYHICSVHTGERPFKCTICEATFVYPEHYKKHALTHSGTKPYSCEVCDRRFNSRDNRNAHRFTHSNKKPYECLVCGVGYMRKPQLYAHMTAQGHLADMIVVNQARFSDEVSSMAVMELHKAQESGKSSGESAQISAAELIDTNICDIFSEKNLTAKRAGDSIKSEGKDNQRAGDNDMAVEEAVLTLAENGEETTQELLSTADVERLLQGSEMITTDGEGNVMRLVQIQLPGGKSGWVALDADAAIQTAS